MITSFGISLRTVNDIRRMLYGVGVDNAILHPQNVIRKMLLSKAFTFGISHGTILRILEDAMGEALRTYIGLV